MNSILLRRILGVLLLNCGMSFNVLAGGSGLNTVVVVNQNSTNSCELGNYFCERRQVPPENVLRITWPGSNTSWTSNDFQNLLVTPLVDMLAARQLTNQIDYVVLSMDIPFQTSFGSTVNGTTSALFYGLKSDNGWDLGVTNSYALSEESFYQAKPASAPGPSFLATMITADSLAVAKQLVDQGVASDGTYPTRPVVLAKSSESDRNLRSSLFDNAIFNVKVRGVSSILRTNADSLPGPGPFLGYETGLEKFNLAPGTFVPGALADNMTSYGGVIFGGNYSQTNLLTFIKAGATGSYGTVAEPGTDPQKFPDPQDYFFQARGFNVAECYYQSVNAPYLGLTLAEPLAAPFSQPGSGRWATGLTNSVVLAGNSLLSTRFSAADGNNPLQQVDLFVDGKYFSTMTNLMPCSGNLITVTLNGYPITYEVPTNATLNTIATGLTELINDPEVSNAIKVTASVHGDRIELQSIATNPLTLPFYVTDTNSQSVAYSVSYFPDSFPPRTRPIGRDRSGVFAMEVEIPTSLHYVIQASTNLADWVPIFTNTVPGLLDFRDQDSTNFPARFYRVIGPVPGLPPTLAAPHIAPGGGLQLHANSQPGQPCAILVSSNLADWAPLFTNGLGGPMDFVDPEIGNVPARFYRAWLVPPSPPVFTVMSGSNGTALVRVDSAVQPYTVSVSTNEGQWTGIMTNFAVGDVQTSTASEIGDGEVLSTFLTASRNRFLSSEAFGRQGYVVMGPSVPIGAWIQFKISKTNGQHVIVGVTNQSNPGTSANLAAQLCALVNTNSALQGSDGVVVEDFAVDQGGTATFKLRARTPGYAGAKISVWLKRYGMFSLPSSQHMLTQNLPDLLPRNHLYVTAGAANLSVTSPLDTTALADGYHELTAVAYAGNHVRTQTRITLPVRIQNTSLTANLALLDLTATAPVAGTYHLQVTANATNINSIQLFSTGGALETITNQVPATFTVEGFNLGAGLHPFYALVETATGERYRTETRWVRLVH